MAIDNQSELGVLEDIVNRLESAGFDYMLTTSPDMEYIRQWAKELTVDALLEE